jgi:hypothetical protein
MEWKSMEGIRSVRSAVHTAAVAAAVLAASCGAPSAPSTVTPTAALSTDPKDLAEALLLGSGPLADPSTLPNTMIYGWPSGSEIRVRASTELSASSLALVQQFVGRIPEATLGHVRAEIVPTPDRDPQALPGEITIWPTTTPQVNMGCPANGLCSLGLAFTPPFLRGARIVGIPDGNFAHELGHAVFNFHHTRNPNVFAKETVMAAGWALTDRDVAMMQSVYRAGLGPGATRAELAAAGIVNP